MLGAAADITARPAREEPVIDTIATSGCSTSGGADVRSPGDHVEHARGETGLDGDLGEPEGRRRGLGRRLEHDRVADRQRRAELPDRHHEREVPRRDPGDDPDRPTHDHRGVAAREDAGTRSLERPRCSGEEAQVVDPEAELAVGEDRPRLSGLAHLEVHQVVGGRERIGHPRQDRRAVAGGAGCPRRQRGVRGRHGRVHVRRRGLRERRRHLTGGRVPELGDYTRPGPAPSVDEDPVHSTHLSRIRS